MSDRLNSSATKYLALDLGEKRIGLALSDTLKIIAAPLEVFTRTSRQADFAHIAQIARAENVTLLIMGLPITLGGEEGRMAAWARDYGQALGEALNLPVTFWDESLSSMQAERSLREQGLNSKQMKGRVDAVAAALILQSYLESQREENNDWSWLVPPSEDSF